MTKFMRFRLLAVLVLAVLLTGCAAVSFDQPKSYSQAIPNPENTALGEYAALEVEASEGLSGFYPLNEGMDALGMRLRLAERAEKSLDLQYFLMKKHSPTRSLKTLSMIGSLYLPPRHVFLPTVLTS